MGLIQSLLLASTPSAKTSRDFGRVKFSIQAEFLSIKTRYSWKFTVIISWEFFGGDDKCMMYNWSLHF